MSLRLPWIELSLFFTSAFLVAAATEQTFTSTETRSQLVELFSSEGCSSCPPADSWINRLDKSPDLWAKVVPVVFHVDYWDYLGWTDRFASREYTQRQRDYVAAWRAETLYTPEFVLNGREWKDWAGAMSLPASDPGAAGVLCAILKPDGWLEVNYGPAARHASELRVEAALLGCGLSSDVIRGENRGRKLTHDFVVLYWTWAGLPKGSRTTTLNLPSDALSRASAIAVWVKGLDSPEVLQATGGFLNRERRVSTHK